MNESNAVLAERFRKNDPSAFDKLVRRHQQLVFQVCLKILDHRQDAEDVTQETFSRMAKYLDRWDSRRPLEPWLIAIAGNRCRTHLSRRRVHQPLSAAMEPASDRTNEQFAAESLQEEVCLALASLPTNHRRAFELFHEQSLNYSEIADTLGCPVGTVKTWVHRARTKLIEQLRSREVVQSKAFQAREESSEVRK
ncbi:MAG: sigma-70 family RNA polymerase sigma factor [Pirellulales bacterium]|nr:sigma-70 family RNA polymerase sigma factor [Pirellulales bacterium]